MGAAEYERFSDAAHRAVVLAEREAREAGHEVAGAEHLLLGLLASDVDVHDRVVDAGVSDDTLRGRIEEWVPPRPNASVDRAVFSPALRRAVHLAGRFATQQRSRTITGLHLLEALLEVEDEFLWRVLISLGVDLKALHPGHRAHRASAPAAPPGFPHQQVMWKSGRWLRSRRRGLATP